MSERDLRPAEQEAVDRVTAMSADDLTEWLLMGFRALVAGDRPARPFGEIQMGFCGGVDVTDDLAAIYYLLPEDTRSDFIKGLNAVFRRLDVRRADDQRSLIFVLRLAAKIQNARLLPLLTKHLFVEGLNPTDEERKLRSVALDVAVELSALSPDATQHLQNIVHSSLFRSSAAATILLALSSASPEDLLDHLFRLEAQLVQVYGDAGGPAREAARMRRAVLLADLAEFVPDSVIGGVVEFALRNRKWRLAWLADVLLDETLLEALPDDEAEKTLHLLDKLRTRKIPPMQEPDWVRKLTPPAPKQGERKEDIAVLTGEDTDAEAEDEIFRSMVERLMREDRGLAHLSERDRELLLEDIEGSHRP